MKKTGIIVIAVVIVLVMLVANSYNKLVTLEESVDSAWAQVENLLKEELT